MSNGIITPEQFEKVVETDVKLNILFGTITSHIERIDKRFEAGNQRFKKLENRKIIDKIWAAGGGIVGGALAAVGVKWGG